MVYSPMFLAMTVDVQVTLLVTVAAVAWAYCYAALCEGVGCICLMLNCSPLSYFDVLILIGTVPRCQHLNHIAPRLDYCSLRLAQRKLSPVRLSPKLGKSGL